MKKLFIVTFLFSLLACQDEIQLEIKSGQPSIVIFGEIHNGSGPFSVRLQKPTSYGNPTVRDFNPEPISEAVVVISDDADNKEVLTEEFPGVYVTKKNGIRGIVGRKYTLTVEALGKKYTSKAEILPEPPQIEAVYEVFNNAAKPYDYGHDVYLKIKDKPNVQNNYLVRSSSFDQFMIEVPPCVICPERFYTRCWLYQHDSNVKLLNDKFVDGQVITQPIAFVPMLDFTDYATYIKVTNGSRNLYNYWLRLDEQSKITGSIFDKYPAQVLGNISGAENEIVLGYFAVIGVKQIGFKFSRFTNTPLDKVDALAGYNADFRPRLQVYDCRNANYFEWDEKRLSVRRYKLANNIGDELPAWFNELEQF